MKKGLKKFAIGLGISLLLLLISAVVVAGFFQEAVGRKLITELNKRLKTELKVGDISLSLLRGFPDATINLIDVSVMGLDKKELLRATEMSFNFRLLSLFGSQVKVHSVAIKDGALNVLVSKEGRGNYDIFIPSESEDGDFSIALEKARFDNIELSYHNDRLKQDVLMRVENAVFAGEFSSDEYKLTSTAKLFSDFVDLNGTRFFSGKSWSYDASIHVNVNKGSYDFEKVKVSIEENVFNVNGQIVSQEKFTDFDLTGFAEDASLESVVALLPAQLLSTFGDFTSTGTFQLDAQVKGRLTATDNPALELRFGLEDGKVSSSRMGEPFKDVTFQATFINGEARSNRSAIFEISNFKGYLNRELMEMSFRLENMDEPYIDFQADGALPVGEIYGLFNHPAITDGKGEIEFKNLKLQGFYKDMLSMSGIPAVNMSGDVEFDDAALTVNDENIIVDRGQLHFKNNLMALDGLKITGAGSEVEMKGNVRNLLPVLFADSLNTQNAALEFQAGLVSPKMDIGRLMGLTKVPVKEGQVNSHVFDSLQVAKTEKQRRITDFLKGNFDARVDEFKYNKIEGKNFTGKLIFENKEM